MEISSFSKWNHKYFKSKVKTREKVKKSNLKPIEMEPYWKTFFWNWQICVEDVKITIGEATLKLVRFTQYASSFHNSLNIFAQLEPNNLLHKTDKCERDLNKRLLITAKFGLQIST